MAGCATCVFECCRVATPVTLSVRLQLRGGEANSANVVLVHTTGHIAFVLEDEQRGSHKPLNRVSTLACFHHGRSIGIPLVPEDPSAPACSRPTVHDLWRPPPR